MTDWESPLCVNRELPLDTPYVPRDSIAHEFVGGSIFQY